MANWPSKCRVACVSVSACPVLRLASTTTPKNPISTNDFAPGDPFVGEEKMRNHQAKEGGCAL